MEVCTNRLDVSALASHIWEYHHSVRRCSATSPRCTILAAAVKTPLSCPQSLASVGPICAFDCLWQCQCTREAHLVHGVTDCRVSYLCLQQISSGEAGHAEPELPEQPDREQVERTCWREIERFRYSFEQDMIRAEVFEVVRNCGRARSITPGTFDCGRISALPSGRKPGNATVSHRARGPSVPARKVPSGLITRRQLIMLPPEVMGVGSEMRRRRGVLPRRPSRRSREGRPCPFRRGQGFEVLVAV